MDSAPEPYSNEWYRRRLARLETTLDRQDNELRDQYTVAVRLKEKVDSLEKDLSQKTSDAREKVGELNGRLEELERKHEKLIARLAEKFKKENGVPV